MSTDKADISHRALDALNLPPQVAGLLKEIQVEIADAYRESFVEMVQTMKRQASQLDRIQATLQVLVQHLAPTLRDSVPAAFRITADDETSDVATAVVVSDPIGMGYSLSQAEVAKALQLPQPYVSGLIRAFQLDQDEECAVVVRRGKGATLVNYHPRVIPRFLELIKHPPNGLLKRDQDFLRLVRQKLGVDPE